MTFVLVEVVKNINTVMEEKHNKDINIKYKEVDILIELEQMKQELQIYEVKLNEMGNSL